MVREIDKLKIKWYDLTQKQAALIIRHDYLYEQIEKEKVEIFKKIDAIGRVNATFEKEKE